jgi:hypothetical protein
MNKGGRTATGILVFLGLVRLLYYNAKFLGVVESSMSSDQLITTALDYPTRSLRATHSSDNQDYVLPAEKTMICYNSQGSARNYWRLKDRFELVFNDTIDTYQFMYHAYDGPCQGCLHVNNTAPGEGRNVAVKATVTSEKWRKCKYLVFFDDDAYLMKAPFKPNYKTPTSQDDNETLVAWREMHDMLLEESTTYPLIAPQSDKWDAKTGDNETYQSCVDEVWWAIRHDHVDFVYPLSTIGKENYWLTNVAMWYVMEKCFPAGVFVDPRWYTKNEAHRYTKQADASGSIFYNNRHKTTNMLKMLNRDYEPLGPWKVGLKNWPQHSCTVKSQPSAGVHPKCKALSEARFHKWLVGDYIP